MSRMPDTSPISKFLVSVPEEQHVVTGSQFPSEPDESDEGHYRHGQVTSQIKDINDSNIAGQHRNTRSVGRRPGSKPSVSFLDNDEENQTTVVGGEQGTTTTHAKPEDDMRQRTQSETTDKRKNSSSRHRLATLGRQPSQTQSVKDATLGFLRNKNDRLEKAIGIQPVSDDQWNRRRLRMSQRCRFGLSPVGTSSLTGPGTLFTTNFAAANARSDVLDGNRASRPRSLQGFSGTDVSKTDVSQSSIESRASHVSSRISPTSAVEFLPKESVVQLARKGFRHVGSSLLEKLGLSPRGDYSDRTASAAADEDLPPEATLSAPRPKAFHPPSSIVRPSSAPGAPTSAPVPRRTLNVLLPVSKKSTIKEEDENEDAEQQPLCIAEQSDEASRGQTPLSVCLPKEDAEQHDGALDDVADAALELQYDAVAERQYLNAVEGNDVGDGGRRRLSDAVEKYLLQPPQRTSMLMSAARFLQSESGASIKASTASTFDDYRPYFTYWITTAQILVMIVALCTYGFGPFGWEKSEKTAMVMTTSLALEAVDFYEPSSFWLGPRAQHLVHLGAKYTPCMRSERAIQKEIEKLREQERRSACCVRNDGSGCVQATEDACSPSISRWLKWPDAVGSIGGWTGGSVCGLDPRYCRQPSSAAALLTWNRTDITVWPKCEDSMLDHYDAACQENGTHCNALALTAEPHMACELVGRPCCYGIRGQCRLATRDFCSFVNGYYHEDAFLCSQVPCLQQACGMMPFVRTGVPDQFYRVFTSLFLHAGLLHLLITVVVHMLLMVNLEFLYGWWRMAPIYLLSGFTGNLVSAIFLPDAPQVGPAASQFALLGLTIVEIVDQWECFRLRQLSPWRALLLPVGAVILFLLIGLLPWVDNFALIFGFLSGLLLAAYLIPYAFNARSSSVRRVIKWLALVVFVVLFAVLVVLFYLFPLHSEDWPAFSWLNCIPFSEDFCNDQNSYFFPKGYSAI